MGRGTKETWPPISFCYCSCLRLMVPALVLNMGTWTSTSERTLRGWAIGDSVQQMRPFVVFSRQQHRSRVSPYWVATNLFAACFWFSCDTVAFYHCVLGKSLVWVFLLGSCPFRFLLCCPLDGETQIWLGDLRLACCLWWFVFLILWFATLHATTCVHVVVFLITASSHVRTEPQSVIGRTRGKKKYPNVRTEPQSNIGHNRGKKKLLSDLYLLSILWVHDHDILESVWLQTQQEAAAGDWRTSYEPRQESSVASARKCIFCGYEHSYNFYAAPTVNLGIDREGTAKSQDGQQKGTLAHVKRKVATALQWRWNLFKNIDIHVHLLHLHPLLQLRFSTMRTRSKTNNLSGWAWRQASKQASRQPRGYRNCNKTKNVRMRESFRGKPRRLKMPFSRLQKARWLFCANFAVAPAGLICLACAILLAVTVWKLTAFSADFGGRCGIYGVCDTEPTLVWQLWHYTPFTVEKTSKTGPACSV